MMSWDVNLMDEGGGQSQNPSSSLLVPTIEGLSQFTDGVHQQTKLLLARLELVEAEAAAGRREKKSE